MMSISIFRLTGVLLVAATLMVTLRVTAQEKIVLSGWKLRPVDSTVGGWIPAVVPGCVFTSYVEAGLEKDPNFADNIYKVDKSKYDRDFVYRAEFATPRRGAGEKVWLRCDGVNRRAELFVNGHRLGQLD